MIDMPTVIGDIFESKHEMIRSFISRFDFDSYKEWFEFFYLNHRLSAENAKEKKWPLEYCRCELEKQELEKIFRERETLGDEEIYEYARDIIDQNRRHIYIYLLVVYQDFYNEDENYSRELWEETIDYFKITKEEMKGARNGWEPDWVK